MKKKDVVLLMMVIVIFVLSFVLVNYFKTGNIYESDISSKNNVTKSLSMNLEQTPGGGNYKQITQSDWPTQGYKFNSELSKCENDGMLTWDDTNKIVVFLGNIFDKCYVYFDKIPEVELSEYIKLQFTGTQGENGIYYHNSNLTNGANDNSYRYGGGKGYKVTQKAIDAGYNTLNDLIIDTLNGIYYVAYDMTETYNSFYSALTKAASDGYADSNINNFICFGSDEKLCPKNNFYRVIGIFSENDTYYTKLIKAFTDEDETMAWYQAGSSYNNQYNNTWDISDFNNYLNNTFLPSLGSWEDKIIEFNWKVAGIQQDLLYNTVKNVYNSEIVNLNPYTGTDYESCLEDPDNCTIDISEMPFYNESYAAKIGLMYMSDYGYAAANSYWTSNIIEYSSSTDNWMDIEETEWTITRATNIDGVYAIENSSPIDVPLSDNYKGRPVFYLDPNINYVEGDGSLISPFRIN